MVINVEAALCWAVIAGLRILLAIDDSEFSEAATQAVIRQFRAEDTELHVLHVLEWCRAVPACFSFARGNTYASQFLSLTKKARDKAAALVQRVAALLQDNGFQVSTAVVDGDPRLAILSSATKWKPDLIVLGSHNRRGLDRFLAGSVSEAVAREAACSVEIVRVQLPS